MVIAVCSCTVKVALAVISYIPFVVYTGQNGKPAKSELRSRNKGTAKSRAKIDSINIQNKFSKKDHV